MVLSDAYHRCLAAPPVLRAVEYSMRDIDGGISQECQKHGEREPLEDKSEPRRGILTVFQYCHGTPSPLG